MSTKIPQKQVSFASGDVASISPKSVQAQRCITAHLDFDAILRLKAAVDEAAATLNRNDRATREGKRAGVPTPQTRSRPARRSRVRQRPAPNGRLAE